MVYNTYMQKQIILQQFQYLPGVGASIAQDLWDLGYRSTGEIKGEDPQQMYASLERLRSAHIDRCMLYVFRCIVYYVNTPKPDAHLLLWWNWKDSDVQKKVC